MDPTLKAKTLARLKDEIASFSPRMQLVAKYILDHPADFGMDPVRQTAEKIGVSTYTLVRLANTLGFETFEKMRDPFRHALVSTTAFEESPEWLNTIRSRSALGPVQSESSENTLALVQTSLQRIVPEELEGAIELMLSARNVYITAVRSSYALAYYLHYVGRMALPTMQLIPRHMSSAIDELNLAGPEDVMFVITVSPYSRESIEACKFAQSRGVKLVILSDSDIVSPELNPTYFFSASTVSTHHFACFTGLMAVIETFIAALVEKGGKAAKARIKSYEDLRNEYAAYWTAPQKKR